MSNAFNSAWEQVPCRWCGDLMGSHDHDQIRDCLVHCSRLAASETEAGGKDVS